MNKKGFIFIETIIVTAVVLASLMLVYSLYISSIASENRRLRYNDTAKLYETFYVRKYLESFNLTDLTVNQTVDYKMIYRSQSDIFGGEYNNEKLFFENLWMELNIQTMVVMRSNFSCENNTSGVVCSNANLASYLNSLDIPESVDGSYRLVIEYAVDQEGNSCTSSAGCFYSYWNILLSTKAR